MRIRWAVLTLLAVLAALAAGCGGDDDDDGGGESGSIKGETLTVWNNEFQPDRMQATEDILADFTKKTGVKTKLVAVPEDQLATLMTNAAAAGKLPDVVLATPVGDSHTYAREELFDLDAAQQVVDKLGKDTFSQKALDIVSQDAKATGVPSDGWGQLLIYRKDLFEKAGIDAPESLDDISAAAEQLNSGEMAGITLATAPVVVGGGRGVGSADGFAPLEELAGLLGGVVGCSRAVTNNGWRNHTDQVGQTGTRIAPVVYLACGISGAIQHWVGAMAAKHIVAVNTDPDANMVAKAGYAVIGDLHEVVPAISAEIRRRRGEA